jgi:gamma-glutamyltranspeptidase/glutathione hydrolase
VGERVVNPRLAEALELLAVEGARALYAGPLAEAVVERSHEVGGCLELDDLRAHTTLPMTPVSTSFQGTEVWELPRPTQGPGVLRTLDVLEAGGRFDTDALIDAIVEGLRSVGIDLLTMAPTAPVKGDTTYIAAVDGDGLGVSLITSVFSEFGSVVGVDALGSPIQNRAAGTSMIGQLPRRGKPPHTTIPGLVTRDGELAFAVGVVGGYMQAQGQVQVLVNLLVHGMEPQAAIDAHRFRVLPAGLLAVEPDHELAARMPEAIGRDPGNGGFGGGQVVGYVDGQLRGGSDPRRNGAVASV